MFCMIVGHKGFSRRLDTIALGHAPDWDRVLCVQNVDYCPRDTVRFSFAGIISPGPKECFITVAMQNKPNIKIGDKVLVLFESGNRLRGTVARQDRSGHWFATFGRGEDAFESSIYWASWDNGVHFSWKENALTVWA